MTIKQEQCLLSYLGYDPGPIDGVDGPRTRAALVAFTADYGVGADGLPGAVAGMVAKKRKPPNVGGDTNVPTKTGTIWDRAPHFVRAEFRCPCGKCGGFPVEPADALVLFAEQMRVDFGMPVGIVPATGDPHAGGSGVRCQKYNDSLPWSVPGSYHVKGRAIDFSISGASDAQIQAYLTKKQSAGVVHRFYKIQPGSWHAQVPLNA